MSEFHINVVKLGSFEAHPNADSLDVTKVFDYTVIAKRGNWTEGQLAVYLPVDAVVPDTEEWSWFLPKDSEGNLRFPIGSTPERHRVVEAKKIRGIFSQGLLAPLPAGVWREGDDLAVVMNITKYEPPVPMTTGGECEPPPKGWQFMTYTDLEGLRRYPNTLHSGEEVVITEKIHGANGRFIHDGDRLWVGSHSQIKRHDPKSIWWQAAAAEDMEAKLSKCPRHIFFGEVYGQVQDLKYGVKSGVKFRVFDVFSVVDMRYLDHDDAYRRVADVGLQWVPILYRGPWTPECNAMAEGASTLADNVREGFVVKPVKERYDPAVGRVILKRHGEGYLLRKKK